MKPPHALIAAFAILFTVLAALPAGARDLARNQGVYAYGGNRFIIRVAERGAVTYLRAYRLAGDQWEPFGATSMPTKLARTRTPYKGGLVERIYTGGKLLGYSDVDLDNPYNTLLNKNFGGFHAY